MKGRLQILYKLNNQYIFITLKPEARDLMLDNQNNKKFNTKIKRNKSLA